MCTFIFGGLYYFNISHGNLTPKYFIMHLLGLKTFFYELQHHCHIIIP